MAQDKSVVSNKPNTCQAIKTNLGQLIKSGEQQIPKQVASENWCLLGPVFVSFALPPNKRACACLELPGVPRPLRPVDLRVLFPSMRA